MRVADYIANTVEAAGADCAFMLTGGMMMHLMDAFGRLRRMRYYCNHHEQASAMAADAYARASGKLGVCLATSGPGATNLLTGLVGAYQDSVPVLFLTGQCKRAETVRASGIPGLRQCGFLEVDIVPIVESVTKYAAFIESPERARYHLEKALYLARNGRPGPVLLDVPLDVQGAPFPEDSEPFIPEPPATAIPQIHELDDILRRIAGADRPLILAGHGVRCAGMVPQFHELVNRLQVPVVTSLMAKDLMPYDHPLFVGHPGPRAERGANFAVQCADLLLIMGCSLHIQTTGYESDLFAPDAYKIQIDIDPSLLERERVGVNAKYSWNIEEYLPALAERAAQTRVEVPETWRAACLGWKEKYAIFREPYVYGGPEDPINLYEFVQLLNESLRGDETILTDAGQPHPVLGQAFRVRGEQRYLNPGSLAEMGYALPASLGAAAANPDKTVIAVFGDGSLQTNIQELQTLVHNGFNVKLFVINNGGYASIRNTQRNFFGGFYVGSTKESGVSLPDIGKIAWAYGVPFLRAENRSAAPNRIRKALDIRGPVLCEVMAQTDQRIMPAVPSYMTADGRMRSKALHEMLPDIGVSFDEIMAEAVMEPAGVPVR
ncbi:MAG TPA: thiamine pyrophosphate-binding protein [Bryobacteraceae bacterium]|nr:thiamine pyrophosphate-binding protein [Bryobacteraceae bacterium]